MVATVNIKNPIEVREAGTKVLRDALGMDVAQAFIYQCEGEGDFTRERHEFPEMSFADVTDMINLASEEIRKRR